MDNKELHRLMKPKKKKSNKKENKQKKEKDADHFEFKTVHLKKINVDLPHACHRTLQALQVYQECLLAVLTSASTRFTLNIPCQL